MRVHWETVVKVMRNEATTITMNMESSDGRGGLGKAMIADLVMNGDVTSVSLFYFLICFFFHLFCNTIGKCIYLYDA